MLKFGFFKWAILVLILVYFVFSNKHYNKLFQQINVKKVHPVGGAGIRTHDQMLKFVYGAWCLK